MLLKTFFIRLLFFSFFTITVVHAVAQNNDPIPSSFTTLPEERIFIHTDRNLYFAGEIIWFKIYYVNATNLNPVTWSKIAYVELINKDSKAVWQSRISLRKDERTGSFHIPLSVATGNYTIRAYTNWMKNDADYFFQKQISIINTLRKQDVINPLTLSTEYHIDFFPESGKLVNGVKTRIGFKLLNRFGNAINGKGYIVDSKNDTLVSFSTYRFGMGNFSFTPFSDERYKAVLLLDDGTVIYKNLPHIYDHGFVMNITSAGSTIDVDLKSNISATIENEPVYFIAKAKNGQLTAKEYFLHNGNLHFSLPKISLGKGIIRCTFFDADKNPLCERLLFNIPDNKQLVTIEADRKEYESRNKVQLSLKAAAADSLDGADLSVSVFQVDSISKPKELSIDKYLWLGSEIKGNIDSIDYYFQNTSEDVEATDNLLMTQGWSMFTDSLTFVFHKGRIGFPMEHNGEIITVKITDQRTNKPASHVQTFLSFPGNYFRFYSAESNNDGIAKFEVPDLYGSNEMIISINSIQDTLYHIDFISPFSEVKPFITGLPFTINKNALRDVEEGSIAMQAQNIYSGGKIRNFAIPEIQDTVPFYGTPVASYQLDNYTRFTTMEEIFREYVKEINVGVRGSQLNLKLLNENQREFATDDVLVLLDGVPLINHNKIFSYDPLKVKRLDVIPRNYIVGPSNFAGITSFITYEGNYQGFDLDPHSLAMDFEGLQLKRAFYSPVYENDLNKSSRLPDFRKTLFWSSNITLSQQTNYLNLYTSDLKGKFKIVVQGIANKGRPVYAETEIEVK